MQNIPLKKKKKNSQTLLRKSYVNAQHFMGLLSLIALTSRAL